MRLSPSNISMTLNGLWDSGEKFQNIQTESNHSILPTIYQISACAEYELWHQQICHAGEQVMQNLHKYVDGVPNLNQHKYGFHKYEYCMQGKVKSAPKCKTTHINTTTCGQMCFTWILSLSAEVNLNL